MCRIGLILLLFFGTVTAQDNWNITNVKDLATDEFRNVKVVGDYAYCATRYGILVMDVSDPENPEVIRRIPIIGTPSSLEISDTLLYLCGGNPGFTIFSISDPEQPVELGFTDELRNPSRLELRDTLAFIACYRTGLSIVSVADPYNPELIGEVRAEEGDWIDVALNGSYAYVSGVFHIISIENVFEPEKIGSFSPGYNGEFMVYGNYLFSAGRLWNVEDQPNPVWIEDWVEHIGQNAFDIENGLFFTGWWIGNRPQDKSLVCINISDIDEPEILSNIVISIPDPSFDVNGMDYDDGYVYATSDEYGMSICDFRNPEHPEEISTYFNATKYNNIVLNGDYLYLPDKYRHLSTYSIEDPYNPVLIDSLSWIFNSNYDGIYRMAGNEEFICLYIAHERDDRDQKDISIISLAEPDSPEEIGWLRLNLSTFGTMVIHGDYLFYTHRYYYSHPGTVSIISLTDPENPEIIGNFGEYEYGYGLDIEGNLMAVGFKHEHESGFVLADISNLENIVELGRCELNFMPADVSIVGEYVYVDEENTLFIISIADPENPEIVNEFHGLNGPPVNYIYEDGCLLISEGASGFEILSLEDPEEPVVTGRYNTPEWIGNFVVKDGLAYTAEWSNLGIYNVSRAIGAWYLSLSEESHNYGEVFLDSTAEWELTIHNRSGRDREITEIITDNVVFTCIYDSTFILSAESDTTLTVTFTPTADTTYTALLEVISGGHSVPVSLSGRGLRLGVVDENSELPREFALHAAYPNPFNSTTTITYVLGKPILTRLAVYDIYGRQVDELFKGIAGAGVNQLTWNADNYPSGIYFVRMTSDYGNAGVKVVLVR